MVDDAMVTSEAFEFGPNQMLEGPMIEQNCLDGKATDEETGIIDGKTQDTRGVINNSTATNLVSNHQVTKNNFFNSANQTNQFA